MVERIEQKIVGIGINITGLGVMNILKDSDTREVAKRRRIRVVRRNTELHEFESAREPVRLNNSWTYFSFSSLVSSF